MDKELENLLGEAENSYKTGNLEEAITLCEKAIAIDSRCVPAYTKLAELYNKKGDSQKAAKQYITIGNAYYNSKLIKGAMKYFQKATELDPHCLEAREKLARIYEIEEMDREAKLEFFKLSEIYFKNNDLHKAEETCSKAIELKSIEAYHIMGEIHLKREMFKEAYTEFSKLIKFKPNHIAGLIGFGKSALKTGKLQDAINSFEKVKGMQKDNVDIIELLITAYEQKGNYKDAIVNHLLLINYYKKTDNKEKKVGLLLKVANLYKKTRDYEKAKEVYKEIISIDPNNEEAIKELKLVSSSKNDKKQVDTKDTKPAKLVQKKQAKEQVLPPKKPKKKKVTYL